jgi:hypothetical protein
MKARHRRKSIAVVASLALLLGTAGIANAADGSSSESGLVYTDFGKATPHRLDGSLLTGVETIYLAGSTAANVRSVSFFLDDANGDSTPITTATTSPFQLGNLDVSQAAPGAHTLLAEVQTSGGQHTDLFARFTTSRVPATAKPSVPAGSSQMSTGLGPIPLPGKTFPAETIGKRFVDRSAGAALEQATTLDQAHQALQQFASQYGTFTISLAGVSGWDPAIDSDVTQGQGGGVTYQPLQQTDLSSVKYFGERLIDEMSKYPPGLFQASNLKAIGLTGTLALPSAPMLDGITIPTTTANPAYSVILYTTVGVAVAGGDDQARETVNHEFDHSLNFGLDKGDLSLDAIPPGGSQFLSYNAPGWVYGQPACVATVTGLCTLGDEHSIEGLVDDYATTADREDFAETFGFLMTEEPYHRLELWTQTDPYLANKVNWMKNELAQTVPDMGGTYFDDINP